LGASFGVVTAFRRDFRPDRAADAPKDRKRAETGLLHPNFDLIAADRG
jgi:hypothetical protein